MLAKSSRANPPVAAARAKPPAGAAPKRTAKPKVPKPAAPPHTSTTKTRIYIQSRVGASREITDANTWHLQSGARGRPAPDLTHPLSPLQADFCRACS